MIKEILILFFALSVYGATDTVKIFISNTNSPSHIDTLLIGSDSWQTIESDISGYTRDSVKSIMFGACRHTLDSGDFYMKEIALYGPDTLIIEDFSCYDTSILIGPGGRLQTDDRYWSTTWVYDGSAIFATGIQDIDSYLHCYYIGRLKSVGSTLHLKFSPDTKDWSQYHTISFTVRNATTTPIVQKKKHLSLAEFSIHQVRNKGLYITLPKQYESLELCLYTVSGKLLKRQSCIKKKNLVWQTGVLAHGAYILTVNDGRITYSRAIVLGE